MNAGARARTARNKHYNRLFAVPICVLCQNARVRCHVLRRKLRQLVWLSVNPAMTALILRVVCTLSRRRRHRLPAERLEILDELVTRKLIRQIDDLMCAPLRWQNNAANLLDLRIVRRRHAIQIARNLNVA